MFHKISNGICIIVFNKSGYYPTLISANFWISTDRSGIEPMASVVDVKKERQAAYF